MASFSLSRTKRDLFERHFRNQKHMSPYLGPGRNANIWKRIDGRASNDAYRTSNQKLRSSIPDGNTDTGLKHGWLTPNKKYVSPEKRDIRCHQKYSKTINMQNKRAIKTPAPPNCRSINSKKLFKKNGFVGFWTKQ